MTDMSGWTAEEKLEYIPFLKAILDDIPINMADVDKLSPNVRTAIRDLLRPTR